MLPFQNNRFSYKYALQTVKKKHLKGLFCKTVTYLTLRCVIPVVCVTNEEEESVVKVELSDYTFLPLISNVPSSWNLYTNNKYTLTVWCIFIHNILTHIFRPVIRPSSGCCCSCKHTTVVKCVNYINLIKAVNMERIKRTQFSLCEMRHWWKRRILAPAKCWIVRNTMWDSERFFDSTLRQNGHYVVRVQMNHPQPIMTHDTKISKTVCSATCPLPHCMIMANAAE